MEGRVPFFTEALQWLGYRLALAMLVVGFAVAFVVVF